MKDWNRQPFPHDCVASLDSVLVDQVFGESYTSQTDLSNSRSIIGR